MRRTLLALGTATGVAVAGLGLTGSAGADQGIGLTGLPAANHKAPGLSSPNVLSPELAQVARAQGSMVVENPQGGIGYYGYDSVANDPTLLPTLQDGSLSEAHKTEPDKNTYLVLHGQTGPDASYDYGSHFLFQGHESGVPGYVTRVNLDADKAHRVTVLATQDQDGPLPDFDGSTYDPFSRKLLLSAEAGCSSTAGVWQGDPSYAANAAHTTFQSLGGILGRGGFEGVQTASDGSIWLVEDVGGAATGSNKKAKLPNSFVYRFVPTDKADLTRGGALQALQVTSARTGKPLTFRSLAPFGDDIADLHSYGKSFATRWVTVHDTASAGSEPFCAGDLAKAAGATPFKRPENGMFRPGKGFGEFYFTETGDTDRTSPANDSSQSTDGSLTDPDNRYGGLGGVFRLAQAGPSASTGTLTLAVKGDLAHTGFDNLAFLTADQLAVVEDAGDTMHRQRDALDSGFVYDVSQRQPRAVRFLAEGRDPSATLDSALADAHASGFSNDGDNEITGIHVSDGDPSVDGLLGAKEPQPFSRGWRVFWTEQHGDNVTWEVVPDPVPGSYGDRRDRG
ncbi:MAG: alkaline phosphatase PhoX [Mycobacteriales bacterium]